MSHSALLIIDVQQSFQHCTFWQEDDLPMFEANLQRLIAGCQQQGIPLVDVFHVAPQGPFSLASGWVKRLPFLSHQADVTVHKQVHNALTESGLTDWLREKNIQHLLIAGIRTEQCCETTTRVAADLGYQVTFITEATLTFPMHHPDGEVFTTEQLKRHTETVLVDRFARIASVDAALAQLTQD